MAALDAFFGIEEFVADYPSAADALEAYLGIEEMVTLQSFPTEVRNAFAYAYEWTTTPPAVVRNGYAYAYEWTTTPPATSRSAYAYAYERTITQDHPLIMWQYTLSGWVRIPLQYVWNGTTWQQVL